MSPRSGSPDPHPRLAVVIPALDAAPHVATAIASVREGAGPFRLDIVVADGGSGDDTADVARGQGARVIDAPRGRGTQLAAGARMAEGDWLLFLHADTVLQPSWAPAALAFVGRTDTAEKAGYFRFVLADRAPGARRIERLVALRCRLLALPYGDQGLLISRALYDAVGGFREIPIMEDVDLVRRLGRRRLVALAATARTSAARYNPGEGRTAYWSRPLRNLICLTLWFLGVPPRWIRRVYG